MGPLVEFARRVLDQQDQLNAPPQLKGSPQDGTTAPFSHPWKRTAAPNLERAGPFLAVKIVNSVIGDYWLILDETESFDPGDGLPIYRPSELKSLKGQGYATDDLRAVHRVKMIMEGRIVRAGA